MTSVTLSLYVMMSLFLAWGINIMISPALLDNNKAYTNAPLFDDELPSEPL